MSTAESSEAWPAADLPVSWKPDWLPPSPAARRYYQSDLAASPHLVDSAKAILRMKTTPLIIEEANFRTTKKIVNELRAVDDSLRRQGREVWSLTAPQISHRMRIVLMHLDGERLIIANPASSERNGVQKIRESCILFPDMAADIDRPASMRLLGHLLEYKANGDLSAQPFDALLTEGDAGIGDHAIDDLCCIPFVRTALQQRHEVEYAPLECPVPSPRIIYPKEQVRAFAAGEIGLGDCISKW